MPNNLYSGVMDMRAVIAGAKEHRRMDTLMGYAGDDDGRQRTKEIDRAQLLVQIWAETIGEGAHEKYGADDIREFLRECEISDEVVDILVQENDPWAIY